MSLMEIWRFDDKKLQLFCLKFQYSKKIDEDVFNSTLC